MGTRRVCIIVGLLCAGPGALPVLAQADAASLPLARVFVGAEGGLLSNDAADRIAERLDPRPGSSFGWAFEAGVALSHRFGVGIEFAGVPSLALETAGTSFRSRGEQDERTLIPLARARVASSRTVALDFVGGVGLLIQQLKRIEYACFRGCAPYQEETLTRRVPAVMLGVDVPVQVARHLAVAGVLRAHLLRRGEPTPLATGRIPWQHEWASSSRVAVGGTARVTW